MKEELTIDEQWLTEFIDENNEWLFSTYKEYIDWFFNESLSKINFNDFIENIKTMDLDSYEWFATDEDDFPVLMIQKEVEAVNSPHSIRDQLQTSHPDSFWSGQWGHIFYEYEGDKSWKIGADVCLEIEGSNLDYKTIEFSADKILDFCLYFSVEFHPFTEYNLIKYAYVNDVEFYKKDQEIYGYEFDEFKEIIVIVPNWKVYYELKDKRANPFQEWFDDVLKG